MREMTYMGCTQKFQTHQTYMLVCFIAILFPTVHANCPVTNACFCKGKKLFCYTIGDGYQVPPFNPSNTIYEILTITHISSLTTVQNNAFNGLKVKMIELSFLRGLTKIEAEAFSGLDDILDTLNILYTNLKTLPSPTLFSHLTQLRYLRLNDNQLESIPDGAFNNLKKLTNLDLSYNKLTAVSPTLFSYLTQLEYLYLSSNQLKTIRDGTFSTLMKLESLVLSTNKLTTLSPTLFSQLTQLKFLRLSYNELETISNYAFNNNELLQTLYLDSNKLTTLSSDMLSNFIFLQFVYVANNPFICDCRLAWLRKSPLHTRGLIMDSPICFSPPNMEGVGITTYATSSCDPTAGAQWSQWIKGYVGMCQSECSQLVTFSRRCQYVGTYDFGSECPGENVKNVWQRCGGGRCLGARSRQYMDRRIGRLPVKISHDGKALIGYILFAAVGVVSILLSVCVIIYFRRKRQNASLADIQPYVYFRKEQPEIVPSMANGVPTHNVDAESTVSRN